MSPRQTSWKQHTMIRKFAIAALAVVTFASATISSARSEPSNAEIAAGLAAAVVGGVLIGKAYQNYKEKKENKEFIKKGVRTRQQFHRDFAADPASAQAKWAPKCQKVQADLKAANCMGQSSRSLSLKCKKILLQCPM